MNDLIFRKTKYQRPDGTRYFGYSCNANTGSWDIQCVVCPVFGKRWYVVHNDTTQSERKFNNSATARDFANVKHHETAEELATRQAEEGEELVRWNLSKT